MANNLKKLLKHYDSQMNESDYADLLKTNLPTLFSNLTEKEQAQVKIQKWCKHKQKLITFDASNPRTMCRKCIKEMKK